MPKQASGDKKKPVAAPKPAPRQLTLPQRHWYNPLSWRFAPPVPQYKKLPKARHLFMMTLRQLWTHKLLFGGIVLIYGIGSVLLVRGVSDSGNLTTLKDTLDGALHGISGTVVTSLTSFSYLVATSGSGKLQNATAYQYLLIVFCSLAFIWAMRQVLAKQKIRVRDAFYEGMYPMIPFFLVFLALGVQLLPLIGGGTLYFVAISARIATNGWQQIPIVIASGLLIFWSLRMITSTIFALYIVTLPNMTPMVALRSAKQLVYGRRLLIWRKLIFMPVALLLTAALIELPLILLLTPIASWVFYALSMLALPVVHGYMYNLYRKML